MLSPFESLGTFLPRSPIKIHLFFRRILRLCEFNMKRGCNSRRISSTPQWATKKIYLLMKKNGHDTCRYQIDEKVPLTTFKRILYSYPLARSFCVCCHKQSNAISTHNFIPKFKSSFSGKLNTIRRVLLLLNFFSFPHLSYVQMSIVLFSR